jgi:hypothetical protein
MSTILKAISDSTTDEVEAAGLLWRVSRISSADLARVGFAALAMATPDSGDADDVEAEDIMKRITPKQAADMASLQEATVAAGCHAVGDGEGNWDELKLVIDQSRHAPDKGVLWVGSLPPGVVEDLFARIMELSTDGEEAAARLASFREKSATPARRRRTSKDIRKVAT